MTFASPAEYLSHAGRCSRLLGLDLGSKTIGIAISDVTQTIASPFHTIQRKNFTSDAAELERLVNENHIGGLVIGLPVRMDGKEGPECQSVRQFARNFTAKRDIPVFFFDERLSTAAVTRTLLEADMSRQKRGKAVDKMAAAYILQNALEFFRSIPA